MERQSDRAATPHLLRAFFNALAVDADMAGIDDGLSQRAAFDQANAVEEAVDPQRLPLELGQLGEGMRAYLPRLLP